MIATIKQVNRTATGYEVVAEFDSGKSKVFPFGESVTGPQIKQAIQQFMREKKEQEGRLPQLKKIIGDTIEV